MNGLLMAVVGFFIGGVANLVSAAISADLGKSESWSPLNLSFISYEYKAIKFSITSAQMEDCRLKLWC